MLKTIARALTVAAAAATALLLTPVQAADAPADYAIANGHYYSQTAAGAKGGYSITNEGGVPMWSEYLRLGGPSVLGYPVSNRFQIGGQLVQLTQRAGLVWHPEIGAVRFLNIFGVLHDAGKDDWLMVNRGIPPVGSDPADAGLNWTQLSQKRYALLDAHPAIKSAYFGIADPVNMYGLPESGWLEQAQVSTMRFDNVVFHQWKQMLPWAAAGAVQLANGGDVLKESGILGPAPFALQPAPAPLPAPVPIASNVQSTPAGFAEASFYADEFVGRHTSSGAVFTQDALTCATNAFPLGTRLKLTTPDGSHSVVVVNNDRPAAWNTRIDLSKAAFAALYPLGRGIGQVKVEIVR